MLAKGKYSHVSPSCICTIYNSPMFTNWQKARNAPVNVKQLLMNMFILSLTQHCVSSSASHGVTCCSFNDNESRQSSVGLVWVLLFLLWWSSDDEGTIWKTGRQTSLCMMSYPCLPPCSWRTTVRGILCLLASLCKRWGISSVCY